MANSTISPNMNLVVPTVGQDPGPDWANNINSSLGAIDSHGHTPGQGVQITTAGLNINADLPLNNNSATGVKVVSFTAQATSSVLGAIYVKNNELFYNDESGNVTQITLNGTVNATSSGISSGTATASFVSGVLVVNANTNTPANIQLASLLLGNNTSGTDYVTVAPPASLAANYTITLPTLPGVASFVSMDTSGNLGTTAQTNVASPIGSMLAYGGSSAPTGWLLCDGSAVSRTTYSPLFAVIGTTFGSGDGSTTFNVPNTMGVFLRGNGTQTIAGQDYTGTLGTRQRDALQGHVHSIPITGTSGSNATIAPGSPTQATGTSTGTPTSDGTNGVPRTDNETRPINLGVNYIIKT